MDDVKEVRMKSFFVATPEPSPIRIECDKATQGWILSQALLRRVEGRSEPVLEKGKDEDFIAGIVSVYGLGNRRH